MTATDRIIEFAVNFRPHMTLMGIPEEPLSRLLPGAHFDELAKTRFIQEQKARQTASLLRSFMNRQKKRQQLTLAG